MVAVFLISIGIVSFNQVMLDKEEGYLKIVNDIQEFEPRLQSVARIARGQSILVVPDWADRIFFPEYSVIISPEDEKVHASNAFLDIANLIDSRNVYYYSASSQKDIDILIDKLKPIRLTLRTVSEVYKGEKLYQFIKLGN